MFIHLAPMADPNDQDDEDATVDPIYDPIITHPNAIEAANTCQSCTIRRIGIAGQGVNLLLYALLKRRVESAQFAFSPLRQLDGVTQLRVLESQLALYLFPGNRAFFFNFGERLFGFFTVNPVFQFLNVLFEKSQVAD